MRDVARSCFKDLWGGRRYYILWKSQKMEYTESLILRPSCLLQATCTVSLELLRPRRSTVHLAPCWPKDLAVEVQRSKRWLQGKDTEVPDCSEGAGRNKRSNTIRTRLVWQYVAGMLFAPQQCSKTDAPKDCTNGGAKIQKIATEVQKDMEDPEVAIEARNVLTFCSSTRDVKEG